MTLVVLVPIALGYALYVREPGHRLIRWGDALHPGELRRWLRASSISPTLVFAASSVAEPWLDAALEQASVVIVPNEWLRAAPRRSPARRANLAARLAYAYLNHPIEMRYSTASELLELAF